MPKKLFATGASLQPFTAGIKDGFTPAEVKHGIIALLDPYIKDKGVLEALAVEHLAGEAICIANLSTSPRMLALFELTLRTRQDAMLKDKQSSHNTFAFFQPLIIQTQKKYALQIEFEVDKNHLDLDEFAFEIFRGIGSVIESTLQLFLKEFYCLLAISKGDYQNPAEVAALDLGIVVDRSLKMLADADLLAPIPWNVRVNQWRNIAQHQTFTVSGHAINAQYGKGIKAKSIALNREELLSVAREIGARLAILRSSRIFAILEAGEELLRQMPDNQDDISAIAVTLIASFATQGFSLVDLVEANGKATATLIDMAPTSGFKRFIHASQFLSVLGTSLPERDIEIQLHTQDNQPHWVFFLDAATSKRIQISADPLQMLGDALDWGKLLRIARENEAKHQR